jgi:hypothetical protein
MNFIYLIVWSFFFIACTGRESEEKKESNPVVEKGIDSSIQKSLPKRVETKKSTPSAKMAHLSKGHHVAFGIKMPIGMVPFDSPSPGIFSFKGPQDIESLRRYITSQLNEPVAIRPNRFGKGYIIDDARIKGSAGAVVYNEKSQRLEIKISASGSGKSVIELWRQTVKVKSNSADLPGNNHAASGLVKKAVYPSTAGIMERFPTKEERVRSTFRVFEKMAKRQQLTAEDYESPYFNER